MCFALYPLVQMTVPGGFFSFCCLCVLARGRAVALFWPDEGDCGATVVGGGVGFCFFTFAFFVVFAFGLGVLGFFLVFAGFLDVGVCWEGGRGVSGVVRRCGGLRVLGRLRRRTVGLVASCGVVASAV
jgi:hypothetical protein